MIFDEKHQLDGLMVRIREPLPPDPHRDTRAPTTFRLPFDGDGYVYQAGPSALHNASHIFNPDQRHAIDFVVWGEGGTHTRTGGARLEDYWAYGADVLAPCDCLVVSVKDGIDDNRPRVETNPSEPFGNVIVLEAAPSIYVVLGHLLPNSVFVTPGQRVRSGQRIARVGNSGNSTEPHLHMHLQDGTKLKAGDGVPLSFTGIVQNGQLMNEATLLRGDVVHMPVERGPRAVSVP
jgi:hypothetical protein